MSDTAAGAPPTRTSAFIPGWYRRIGTDRKGEQIREAVRTSAIAGAHFPLYFLRADEFVRPARSPQCGVTIAFEDRGVSLAVPPGYWIVRDSDGELRNWSHDEFTCQWVRLTELERPWCPPIERDAIDEILDEGPPDADWRGTPPAEGTRRRLILDVIEDELLGSRNAARCLAIADAIEAALLDATIGAEEQLAEKREELMEVHRFLDKFGAPSGPEISSPTVLRRLRALVERFGSFTVGEGLEWPLPPGKYEIRLVPREAEVEGAAKKIVSPGAEEPDAEIVDSDGHPLAGLHVVLGAQDGVPYLSLIELEHLFANLYEDITERQAKEQRGEATFTGTMEARDGESPTCAVDAIDESDVQREATRALYDRITDGPVPNPAELARVIAILGGPVGVGR